MFIFVFSIEKLAKNQVFLRRFFKNRNKNS